MNCQEIKIGLHDFVDGHSDGFMKREIETHLRSCDKCFNDYKKLKVFLGRLKDLSNIVDPPEGITQTFASKFLEKSIKDDLKEKIISDPAKIKEEQVKLERSILDSGGAIRKNALSMTLMASKILKTGHSQSKINWSKIILILLPFVLLAAAYFVYDLQKFNSPWTIKTLEGMILINGKVNNTGTISEGESLSTSDSSQAEIFIPRVGSIEVNQNSIIILKKTKDDDNRIKLEKGSVKIKNISEARDFAIELKNCSVIDQGGEFSIIIDEFENVKISVNSGFTEIIYKKESYFLNEKYVCDIMNGKQPGTPYRSDAPDTLTREIKQYDYNNGGDNSIDNILSMARNIDMLTILAIIPRASQIKREILFQTITNYFPPPENVTRMDIIMADKKMLHIWWAEIKEQLKFISDHK